MDINNLSYEKLSEHIRTVQAETPSPTPLNTQLSATPPMNANKGDLWYLPADPVTGTTWQFKYNTISTSPYKWEFVGGAPIRAFVVTSEAIGTVGAWKDLTTVGPSVVLPREGDYIFQYGADVVAAGAIQNQMYLNIAAAGGVVPQATNFKYDCGSATGGPSATMSGVSTFAASGTKKLIYFVSGSVASTFDNRWLFATPTRVK